MIHILGVIVNGHWKPGIGDPNFMGWLITAAYLITSVSCGIYAWRTDRISPVNRSHYHRAFWLSLALIMLIMGSNKQLDLQCLFIAVIRKIALAQGWYSQRHIFEMWFVACVAIFGMIVLIWVGWKLKRLWRQYGLALFGILVLIIFVFVRATPVQYVAKSPSWRPVMRTIDSVLELTGIGLIEIAALLGIIRGIKQTDRISES